MELEKFIYILDLIKKSFNNSTNLYKYGVDVTALTEPFHETNELLLKEIFTEEGYSWIEWFLYEKGYVTGTLKDLKAYNSEGEEIVSNVEELYSFLVENKFIT